LSEDLPCPTALTLFGLTPKLSSRSSIEPLREPIGKRPLLNSSFWVFRHNLTQAHVAKRFKEQGEGWPSAREVERVARIPRAPIRKRLLRWPLARWVAPGPRAPSKAEAGERPIKHLKRPVEDEMPIDMHFQLAAILPHSLYAKRLERGRLLCAAIGGAEALQQISPTNEPPDAHRRKSNRPNSRPAVLTASHQTSIAGGNNDHWFEHRPVVSNPRTGRACVNCTKILGRYPDQDFAQVPPVQ
jgi:hypothetical protein